MRLDVELDDIFPDAHSPDESCSQLTHLQITQDLEMPRIGKEKVKKPPFPAHDCSTCHSSSTSSTVRPSLLRAHPSIAARDVGSTSADLDSQRVLRSFPGGINSYDVPTSKLSTTPPGASPVSATSPFQMLNQAWQLRLSTQPEEQADALLPTVQVAPRSNSAAVSSQLEVGYFLQPCRNNAHIGSVSV